MQARETGKCYKSRIAKTYISDAISIEAGVSFDSRLELEFHFSSISVKSKRGIHLPRQQFTLRRF